MFEGSEGEGSNGGNGGCGDSKGNGQIQQHVGQHLRLTLGDSRRTGLLVAQNAVASDVADSVADSQVSEGIVRLESGAEANAGGLAKATRLGERGLAGLEDITVDQGALVVECLVTVGVLDHGGEALGRVADAGRGLVVFELTDEVRVAISVGGVPLGREPLLDHVGAGERSCCEKIVDPGEVVDARNAQVLLNAGEAAGHSEATAVSAGVHDRVRESGLGHKEAKGVEVNLFLDQLEGTRALGSLVRRHA